MDHSIKLVELIAIVISIIGMALAWITLLVPIKQFLGQKKLEEKDKRFKNYHRLIDDLVGGNGKGTMAQRQMAIIFELRNYPEYFEVSMRILQSLLEFWKQTSHPDVIREIEVTLDEFTRKVQ